MIYVMGLLLLVGASTASSRGEAVYLSGVELRSAGDLDGAVSQFNEVVEYHPQSPFAASALLLWAEIEEDRGADDIAGDLYRRLLAEHPTHRLARTATTRIEALDRRRTLGPVQADYEELLAGYADAGPQETRAAVQQLIDGNPGHTIIPSAECWLGNQARQAARFDDSIAHYRRSLDADPRSDCARRALDHIGNVALNQGDLSTARRAFESLTEHGDAGESAAAFHLANLRRAEMLRLVWCGLWIGSVTALLLLLIGLPWDQLHWGHARTALAVGATVAAAMFIAGAFGGPPARTLLLPIALLLAPITGAVGVLLRLRTRHWYRVAWPLATTWLAVAAVYGSLYTLDRF